MKIKKSYIIAIVLVLIGVISIVLGTKNPVKKALTPTSLKVKEYVGYYGTELKVSEEENSATYFENLYLKKDGTFVLDINSFGASSHPTAGTYTINEKEITLTEKIRYSGGECYFTDQLQTYKVEIKDENTLTIHLNDKIVDYIRSVGNKETDKIEKYYVTNPKDGEEVAGLGKHVNCTNK